jgi:hypothetical protein
MDDFLVEMDVVDSAIVFGFWKEARAAVMY